MKKGRKIRDVLLGRALEDSQLNGEKFSVLWGIPIFASDAISSVSYAGEEILLVLVPVMGLMAHGRFLPIVIAIIALLAILVFCYRQTIDAYPQGGGAYIVASENLGETVGLVAGASLIMGYVLTVAVSSCASAAAIASAFPALYPHKSLIAFALICLLTWGNLRGIRDSAVMFGIPTYLFILSIFTLIIVGLIRYMSGGYTPAEVVIVTENARDTLLFVTLKAFASGCTALTGIEAVSNGVPNFKNPAQKHAKTVLLAMAGFVAFIFFGVSLLTKLYQIVPEPEITVTSQLAAAVFGRESVMYYVFQIMTVVILALAANTAFADVPLLLSLIAQRGFMPRQFTQRGARLNFSNGIIVLFASAALLVFLFHGDQHHLLPLYASGVFISFTLSQAGMFVHWRRCKGAHWRFKAGVNAFGTWLSCMVLVIITVMKFSSGAWITLICIVLLVLMMKRIKRHYNSVADQLRIEKDPRSYIKAPELHNVHVLLPVYSLNKSFLKALNYALSIRPEEIELFHVSSDPERAKKLETQIDALALKRVFFASEYTALRNTNEVLLRHIDAICDNMEPHQTLTVVLPQFVSTAPLGNLLHSQTSIKLKLELLTRRNVSVISVPYLF